MDDGDLDFSMGSYLDDVLGGTAEHLACCTHTHTCNPPAYDLPHTHTCLHVHSKLAASASFDAAADSHAEPEDAHATSRSKKRRPSGNRAAVRKYREKKKEHTAVLQEEAARLRALNEQPVRKH
ncbi:basic leucine zipper 19-like [Triticum aestivum]|nr:basic leucine zipper 19-like [Triticum aestivum]